MKAERKDLNDPWYEQYHRPKETPEFVAWFEGDYYGYPEDYEGCIDEVHEYWVRRAFVLRGFLFGKGER